MTDKEKVSLIFLSEKVLDKKDSDILLKISDNFINGEIKSQDFIYIIGNDKKIMSLSRIWNYILSQISSRSEKRYLSDLNKYLEQFDIPQVFFEQCYYINPEDNKLKPFIKK